MALDGHVGEDPPLGTLSPLQRRRLIAIASLRPISTTVVVVAVYFLIPMDRSFGLGTVIGLVLGGLALFAIIGWQIWKITRSGYPTIRAVEALALIIPLYILFCATVYFLMNRANGATFGGPVSHVDAMYFSTTVFTTVGFGDITAKTEAARIIVTIQMMLDLVIIGLVARLVINAIKIGQHRRDPTA